MSKLYSSLGYFFCELAFKWWDFSGTWVDPAHIAVGKWLSPPFEVSHRLGCWFYGKSIKSGGWEEVKVTEKISEPYDNVFEALDMPYEAAALKILELVDRLPDRSAIEAAAAIIRQVVEAERKDR